MDELKQQMLELIAAGRHQEARQLLRSMDFEQMVEIIAWEGALINRLKANREDALLAADIMRPYERKRLIHAVGWPPKAFYEFLRRKQRPVRSLANRPVAFGTRE